MKPFAGPKIIKNKIYSLNVHFMNIVQYKKLFKIFCITAFLHNNHRLLEANLYSKTFL